ncbi:MAG: hypothetical protein AABZ06_09085, partial [Bdellovibrionota bacterium]
MKIYKLLILGLIVAVFSNSYAVECRAVADGKSKHVQDDSSAYGHDDQGISTAGALDDNSQPVPVPTQPIPVP